MRLNIGSGNSYKKGFTNIDIEERYKPDVVADFRTLKYSGVEMIEARHILEHFSRDEAFIILKKWYYWLKKGGTLLIEVPDFEEICNRFVYGRTEGSATGDKNWLVRHAYGSQEADWAFHKDGWWKEKFEKILPEVGFKIILIKSTKSRVRDGNRKIALPNLTVGAEKYG